MTRRLAPWTLAFLLGTAFGHHLGSRSAHAGFLDDMKKAVSDKAGVVGDLKAFGLALKQMDEDVKSMTAEMERMREARSNIASKLGVEKALEEKE